MSKFTLKSTAVLAGVLILTPALATVASAATYNSNADVSFEANSSITQPVDPTTPGNAKPDLTPTPTPGTGGPLAIDFASSLQFGTNKISTSAQTYYAHAQQYASGDQRPDFVQVTDKRGTLAGWTLSVKTANQFHLSNVDPATTTEDKAKPGDYINGAAINFTSGQVQGDQGTAPGTVKASLSLGNADQTIVTAAANQGAGTWIYRLGASENDYDTTAKTAAATATKGPITLTIPEASVVKAGNYTTNLVWTLSDTPGN